MMLVGDFKDVVALVARVLLLVIGIQTSWCRTFTVAVAHRWHNCWQSSWKGLVLTGWYSFSYVIFGG